MKIYVIILLFWLSLTASAQVVSTHKDKAGTITKYVSIQFGKDTIITGVPFHSKDKPGVTLSISSTGSKNFFTFNVRSLDPAMNADTMNKYGAYLVISLGKSDSLMIAPAATKYVKKNFWNTDGSVFGFIQSYLSDAQLSALTNNELSGFRIYPGTPHYVTFTVTEEEKRKFHHAIYYLLN